MLIFFINRLIERELKNYDVLVRYEKNIFYLFIYFILLKNSEKYKMKKMKNCLIMIFTIFFLLVSCENQLDKEKKIRNKAIAIAEKYITSQIDSTKKEVFENGTISIGNERKMYVINPAMIYPGFINSDKEEDAIVTLDTFSGQYQTISEQLIIISSEGKPVLERTLESDMRILAVKDGIITAEVPEHSRNSPLFYCPSCREVVKFRYVNGDLVKTEE